MRVIVTGGRDYKDVTAVFRALHTINDTWGITSVIHGACLTGADTYADDWAEANFINIEKYRAEWTEYGPSAGPRRNKRMVEESNPDFVLAFPGGAGTANCIKWAVHNDVKVVDGTLNHDKLIGEIDEKIQTHSSREATTEF